ncbi:MAG TPA: GNAT family protein [Roseiflexaceae bacterium]|nr:GNAT family protein [Roseiflexaceae bacterium]HMP39600.1 GNAT family protein [Roseiflexaceae bacterium]
MEHDQSDLFRPEVIPGERIFLSHVLRSDIGLLTRWFADLELTTYLGGGGMSFTREHEEQWFDGLAKDRSLRTFGIVVREPQQLIGTVSLMSIDHARGNAELGIAIGDKAAWGQGYGSEAVRLMADYGLTFLNLQLIYLWHVAYNERGHRAYLKAGFKPAGRLRGAEVFDGRRYDRILMDITREDLGPSQLRGLVRQIDT